MVHLLMEHPLVYMLILTMVGGLVTLITFLLCELINAWME